MTEMAFTLRIGKVGDKEALNALNDLDKRGRKIVEDAAGAMGRAMGDVAATYTNGSKRVKQALEEIADGHRKNVKEIEAEQRAAERSSGTMEAAAQRLEHRQSTAVLTASRGIEQLARSTQSMGSALDSVIAQTSQIAFGFGTAGPIVGAIGVATIAIVEMFNRAKAEAKKAVDEMTKEFDRIAHSGVAAQGKTAQLLFEGDPMNGDPNSLKGLSLRALEERQKINKGRIAVGTMDTGEGFFAETQDAKVAAEKLKEVNKELERRRELLGKILGPSGTMARAGQLQAIEEQGDFVTEAIRKREREAKESHQREVSEFVRLERLRAGMVKKIAADLEDKERPSLDAKAGLLEGLGGDPSKMKDDLFEIGRSVAEAIKNNPLLSAAKEFDKQVEQLAKHMQTALSESLGEGIASGFEAAFSGAGIGASIDAFGATVLSSLGGFLERLGAGMVLTGTWLTAFSNAIKSLNGPAAIAAGIGLIAAGAALKAIAGSFGGDSHGGRGASAGQGGSIAQIIDRGIIMPGAYSGRDAREIQARPTINANFTFVGPNDPAVVRQFDEILKKINQRGSLAG